MSSKPFSTEPELFSKWNKIWANYYPNAPCMEYLPTFPLECGHFSPNVGKYSLHGASGLYFLSLIVSDILGTLPLLFTPTGGKARDEICPDKIPPMVVLQKIVHPSKIFHSKKSPTGPTERTPKPEYLIALASYLGVRW